MGADQSLIAAAGKMGPKDWDYSGIMKGIAALGKYAATKQSVANELTSYGNEAFDVKEMPDAMTSGPFGQQNMDFLMGAKEIWNESTNDYRNPVNLPFSKKYKQAVANINNVKKVLEKNKADLLVLADVKKNINQNWLNRSAGVSRAAFHRIADLQINNTTGDLDNAMRFTTDGVKIYTNDVVNMQTAEFGPDELLNGFFTNHMNTDNNNGDLAKIIKNNGEKRKNTNKQWNEGDARDQIRSFMQQLKDPKYGNNGIRSLAFDFQSTLGGGSFVQANRNLFIDPNLSGEDATKNYVDQYKLMNPGATEEELTLAYAHQAADVWDGGGTDYEGKVEDWLVGIAKADYDKAQPKSDFNESKQGTFQIGPLGGWVDSLKMFGEGNSILKRIQNGEDFPVGVLNYKKINGQWALNDARGLGKEIKSGENKGYYFVGDGSNKALHENLRVVNDPRFEFLLK
tara:strand:- start:3027 stop:4394 length:1368 start_codon:yes stop_codon:yes gene_type:complete